MSGDLQLFGATIDAGVRAAGGDHSANVPADLNAAIEESIALLDSGTGARRREDRRQVGRQSSG